MLSIVGSTQFVRDVKLAQRRGKDLRKLKAIVLLENEQPLPERCRDHPLQGAWQHYRDCHIEPDWLLIYRIEVHQLYLARTGAHTDLFGTNSTSPKVRTKRPPKLRGLAQPNSLTD